VAIQGIRMLRHVDFHNDKNVLIAALSIGLGLGVSVEPTIFQSLPTTLQLLLGNGIVMASLSAVLLNLILRPRQPEAELEEDDGLNEEE